MKHGPILAHGRSEPDFLFELTEDNNGCAYFDDCLTCPLVDCMYMYQTYESGVATPFNVTINAAIRHSWEVGIRDPSFPMIYRGDPDGIPDDIVDSLREEWDVDPDVRERPQWVPTADAMRETGYQLSLLARVFGRAVHVVGTAIDDYHKGKGIWRHGAKAQYEQARQDVANIIREGSYG